MKKKVNVIDSIKSGKVVFEKDFIFKVSDFIILFVILFFLWRVTLDPIIESIKLGYYYNWQNSLFPIMVSSIITIFWFYKIFTKGKLKRIKGHNFETNREVCRSFIKEKKWIVLVDNKKQLRVNIKHFPFFTHTTELLILFDKDDVNYQILNFGHFGIYYILIDFSFSSKYLNEFEKHLQAKFNTL